MSAPGGPQDVCELGNIDLNTQAAFREVTK
ncbi:hypothetical protein H4W33_002656 [Kibdelosporangium phytohabitans]|nr:hypothetical protein [Kibdelosporangium phytohabitans]